MNTLPELPWPSSVRTPVMPSEEVDLYRPGASVSPPRSPALIAGTVRPAASRYAAVRSLWAKAAGPSATCSAPPTTIAGGNPVMALPGLTPTLPLTTEGPVLVTVEAPNMVKVPADPRVTGNWAACRQTLNVMHGRSIRNSFICIYLDDSWLYRFATRGGRQTAPWQTASGICANGKGQACQTGVFISDSRMRMSIHRSTVHDIRKAYCFIRCRLCPRQSAIVLLGRAVRPPMPVRVGRLHF